MTHNLIRDNNGSTVPFLTVGVTQKVTVSDVSKIVPLEFQDDTNILRVASTTDCYVKIGKDPISSDIDFLLPAGVVEYFKVPDERGYQLAAIRVKKNGILTVSEMT